MAENWIVWKNLDGDKLLTPWALWSPSLCAYSCEWSWGAPLLCCSASAHEYLRRAQMTSTLQFFPSSQSHEGRKVALKSIAKTPHLKCKGRSSTYCLKRCTSPQSFRPSLISSYLHVVAFNDEQPIPHSQSLTTGIQERLRQTQKADAVISIRMFAMSRARSRAAKGRDHSLSPFLAAARCVT